MADSITAPYGLETNNPQPEIKRYYNLAKVPYADTAQAISQIPIAVRYLGQTVNIDGAEYWWKESTADEGLIIKNLQVTSTSLIVTNSVGGVAIDLPEISEVPSLIVNNAYTPTRTEFLAGNDRGYGTAARPFTDTITSWTLGGSPVRDAGSAIQNALDAYKGTGGKGTILDSADPQLLGSIIQIEKGNGVYYFSGDLDYLDASIKIKAGAIIGANISDWVMDFTKFATNKSHQPVIDIEDGAYLFCNKNGFKLVSANFPNGSAFKKNLRIIGGAKNTGVILTGTLESYILFEVNGAGQTTYLNGGFQNLSLSTFVATTRGTMFSVKGNGVVDTNDSRIYFLTDPLNPTITITNTNPIIEIADSGFISFVNSTVELGKTASVTYTQLVAMEDTSNFEAINSTFKGFATYFVRNVDGLNTAGVKLDGCKMYLDTTTSFAHTASGVWSNFVLTNNNMPSTSINAANTVLVPSSINTIGSKLVETLNTYYSRVDAIAAGLPLGAKFIKRTDLTTGDFVVGVEYKILNVGNTDFTLIGAASNTVGLYFTALNTGNGTTGTVSLLEIDIIA